jgi:hypothetical protein
MAAALAPLLDLAGLVDLEARPGCEVRWDLVPCPRAASWRGRSSCPACGRVFSDLVCEPCRERLDALWDDCTWTTTCCEVRPSRYTWTRL